MSTIIVTGASGDIGSATIRALMALGHDVIGVSRTVANEDGRELPACEMRHADLGDAASIEALVATLPERFDWLVTAHGYIDPSMDPLAVSAASVERTFSVNATSQIHLVRHLRERMQRGMILISSSAGTAANGRIAAYSASKAAVSSLAQGFARNISDRTFMAICPGPTAGRMRERIGTPGGQPPSAVAALIADIIEGTTEYVSGDVLLVKDEQRSIVSRIG